MTLAILHDGNDVTLCTEQPHKADTRFTAYARKGDNFWLGVDPNGAMTWTPDIGSFQAFKAADGASFLLADRTAFGGKVYRIAYVAYTEPAGPSA